jgi:hypothetical protein
MPWPSRIIKDRACQRDDVGFSGGHNRLGLFETSDQSDGNDGNSDGCFDSPSQWHLIVRPYGNPLRGMETAARNMGGVAAYGFEHCVEGAGLFNVPTSFDPVGHAFTIFFELGTPL